MPLHNLLISHSFRSGLTMPICLMVAACGGGDDEQNWSASATAKAQACADFAVMSYTTITSAPARNIWAVETDVSRWPVRDLGSGQRQVGT